MLLYEQQSQFVTPPSLRPVNQQRGFMRRNRFIDVIYIHTEGETTVGGRRTVIPKIEGRAHVTGYAQWLIVPDDPVGGGSTVF